MGLRGPKAKINHQAFSGLGPEALYWAGILATDGSVCFGKGRSVPLIRYGCEIGDIVHVYKLKEFLQSGNKVALAEHRTVFGNCMTANLAFSSLEIGEFLMRNGVGPKKSLTLCVSPLLADSRDFWRGAVDGDGTVCIPERGVGAAMIRLVSGSVAFINQFADFCKKALNFRPNIRTLIGGNSVGSNPGYVVALGNEYMRQLVRLLYNGDVVAMDRKKNLADRIILASKEFEYSKLSVVRTVV